MGDEQQKTLAKAGRHVLGQQVAIVEDGTKSVLASMV